MNSKLRQEILNELKSLLDEQIFVGDESLGGLNLTNAQQEQIKNSPEEAANYLYKQNTSNYVNVDEAKLASDALSRINTPELASRFLNQWKKVAGNVSISLKGGFVGKGNEYQKQVAAFGKEIQALASSGAAATPAEQGGATPAEVPGQALKISCKRCRGLGKGCPESKDVRELQDTLAKLKFMNQQEAGFGDATEAAVKAFQKSKNLKDDGVVGPRTCVALGLMKASTPTKPATKTGGNNTFLKMENISNQLQFEIKKAIADEYKLSADDLNNLRFTNLQRTANQWIAETLNKNNEVGKYRIPNSIAAKLDQLPKLQESKNYYDNKKLNEAKELYNKLLKNL